MHTSDKGTRGGTAVRALVTLVKLAVLAGGAVVAYRKRGRITRFFKSQNVVIASLFGALTSAIVLLYRAVAFLFALIQQAAVR